MRRVRFVTGVFCIILLGAIAYFTAGCKSPESDVPTYDTKTFTSTTVDGHYHTATLTRADIQARPDAGVTVTTTNVSGHTHTLHLTKAQCESINNSISVTVSTSTDSGHSHEFSIANWWW